MEKENHTMQFKDMPAPQAPECSGVIPYLSSNNVAGISGRVLLQYEALQGRQGFCNGIQKMALNSFRKLACNKCTWFKRT